ncbi:MAG TPA: exosortase K [Pyrinomonadaceae bacterium]|nr:exosortase K [Pyrinomonadaceae bacterium]
MKPIQKWTRISQLVAVLLCSAAIKMYYSSAGVNDLLWILTPTRLLVGLATGVGFTYESNSGYMSSDHSFLIAAACSGVNFMITAFLMLAVGRLWKFRSQMISWTFIPVSLVFAYLTTIVANTVRISIALYIRRADPELIWLNPGEMHRFEGIVVYFGFLLLLFVASEKFGSNIGPQVGGPRGLLRRTLLPLAVYYATTIGVPLANGVFRHGPVAADFWLHSLFVLLTPLFLLLTLAILSFLRERRPKLEVETIEYMQAADI